MGSNGKKKTTMQKLNRETKLRERREEKEARKNARREAVANGVDLSTLRGHDDEPAEAVTSQD